MSVFAHYARYYDLLYRDKDYALEAKFITSLLTRHAVAPVSILELGCGTGHHAQLMAETGLHVHGVDRSAEMLQVAVQNQGRLEADLASRLAFSEGDLRTVRLGRQFDAVVSLFHVFCYQTTEADLLAALKTARVHLEPGGVLIFDLWYGPAVLSVGPATRVKRLEDERLRVVRTAEPVLRHDDNCVDVHYQVFIHDKANRTTEEVHETHRLRYLFKPEVESLLARSGFACIDWGVWLSGLSPEPDSWNVYCVARA